MPELIETEVLVVGLGAVGAAVAYQLSRRGVDFVGLDRHRPPHDFGSSHGESRITRTFVGEGAEYVPLVKRSHEIWAELETAGRRLRERTGLLYLSRAGGEARRHGAEDFMAATQAVAMAETGRPLPRLDAGALRRAYPHLVVTDDTVGYLEPEAGYVRPELCLQAQLDAVAGSAARLRFGETALAIEQAGDRVVVVTDRARYRAARAVITAGPWLPGLAGGPFGRLVVRRQVLHWFRMEQPQLWADAPVFLWFHGPGDADLVYGFPPIPGGVAGVKVATEQYVEACDPDTVSREVSADESRAMYETHVRGRLQGVTGERLAAKACLYTCNAEPGQEGRFVIGPHPRAPKALCVSACSGHGFKHSAGLGDALVRQILGESGFCDLSVFAPRP